MYEDGNMALDGALKLEVVVVLTNIKKFFHDNKIGARQGVELVQSFVRHAFTGGSIIVESSSGEENSDGLKAWLDEMDLSLNHELAQNTNFSEEMVFSGEPMIHSHVEMLREAFWETIFIQQQKNSSDINGTCQIITCLLILKALHPHCTLTQITTTQ